MADSGADVVSNSGGVIAVAASDATMGVVEKKSVGGKKKSGGITSVKPKVKKSSVNASPSHPPTQQMVDASIKYLKERNGSSLSAIKKYMSVNYKVDAQKMAPFIKKYLKSAVGSGKLIQTKGKGASGSFKLSAAAKIESAASEKKKKSVSKVKSSVVSAASKVKKSKTAGKTKTASAAGGKVTKKAVGIKNVKKATAGSPEKKLIEKAKAKSVKSSGLVKSKPVKGKSTAVKPKVPKVKSAGKAKKTTATATSKKAVAKK